MKNLFLLILLLVSITTIQAQVVYVDADASGTMDGTSWQNAYTNLSDAIEAAQSGNQIWVAAGVYYPTAQPNYPVGSADPRFNHFTLKNGVTLYGGFAGDESSIDQRDLVAYKTVLSGDIDQNDNVGENGYVTSYTDVNGGNSLKLFYFPENTIVDTTAVLDGFVLAGAVADNDVFPYMGGAAFLCQGASPKVVNCEFYGNYAKVDGGAIWIRESAMIIENCTFSGNYAEVHAGAVHFANTSAKLKACSFYNNSGAYGGAVYVEAGSETSIIEDCIFDGNNGRDNGGGISVSNAKVFLKNTSFTNNIAGSWGGGVVFHVGCDVDMVNCIVNNNTAGSWGGGFGLDGAADNRVAVRITNTKVQGNEAGEWYGGGLALSHYADCKIYNSLFSGNKIPNHAENKCGEAITVENTSTIEIYNSTFVPGASNGHGEFRVVSDGSSFKMYNSIIWDWNGEFYTEGNVNVEVHKSRSDQYKGTNGNFGINPLINTDPATVVAPTSEGDFRLRGNSPANNAASNSYLPNDVYDLDGDGDTEETIPYDIDGNPRIFAGVVDMGCYEQRLSTKAGNGIGMWDGNNLTLGSGIALNNTNFTIELWYFMQEGMNGDYHNIFGCDPTLDNTTNRCPTLYVFQNDRIHYGYGDNSNWNAGNTEKALKLNQWNHIALAFDNATNTQKVYANGKLLETMTSSGEVSATPLFRINNDEELHGIIDEFRVWKEERSLEDLIANMNTTLTGNEENLALYYSFDQVTNGDIEDLAGSNSGIISKTESIYEPGVLEVECGLYNSDAIFTPILKGVSNIGIDNFTISWNAVPNAFDYYIDVATDERFNNLVKFGEPANGATTYNVTGLSKGTVYYYKVTCKTNDNEWGRQYGHTATKMTPPGNAMAFDGSTYVDATDVCKYDYPKATTIECWVKKTSNNTSYTRATIWSCNTADGDNNYLLFVNNNDNHIWLASKNDVGGDHSMHFNYSAILNEGWHHIAVTINSLDSARLYIDGQAPDYPTEPIAIDPLPYGTVFSLGQEFDGTSASDFFIGEMDEFRIWNKVLTEEEIRSQMMHTLTGNEEGLVTYYNFDQQTGTKVIDNANVFDGNIIGNVNWVESNIGLQDFVVIDTAQSTSGFNLVWNAVKGATNYTVDVATDVNFLNKVITADGTTDTAYNATGLNEGTKYYFRVNSNNGASSSVNYTSTLMEVPGNALWLDGKDDYVDISQITEIGIREIVTMECWAYVDPTETNARFLAINPADGSNKFLLSFDANKGYYLFNANSGVSISSYDTRKGMWVHLAAAMHSGSTTSFYLNGELVGTANNGQCPIYPGEYISIGMEYDGARKTDFFKGAIDEVRFWKGTRTPEQIKATMHTTLSGKEDNLIAYYDFDQSEGAFVYEKANGLDGTIISQPQWVQSNAIITPLISSTDSITADAALIKWYAINAATDYKLELASDINFTNIVNTVETTSGDTSYVFNDLQENTTYFVRVASLTSRWGAWSVIDKFSTLLIPPGNALVFNGVDGEVNIGKVMKSDWDSITVEAWVKLAPDQNGYPRIVGSYSDGGFAMNLWNETMQPYFEFQDLNSNTRKEVKCAYSISDNVWHHLAGTYNGTDMKLYIDGELVATTNIPGAKIKQQVINTGIGNQNGAAPLNGTLDEIRIWKVARSQAQIKEFAHKALSGNESGLVSYFNLDKAEGTTFKDEAGNFDGTMTGGVTWVESKALITPFVKHATDITDTSFMAKWEAVPSASKYIVRVATDKLLTQPVEGMDSIVVDNILSLNVTGLTPSTIYYYGVMSITDRASAWSAGEKVITTGTGPGELAIDLEGNNNYLDMSAVIPKLAGKNAGAVTAWFKAKEEGLVFRMEGDGGYENSFWLHIGSLGIDRRSFVFEVWRGGSIVQSMSVMNGNSTYLDNKWHHIAIITGDGNNRILLDGEEQEIWYFNNIGDQQTQEFTNILNPQTFVMGKDFSVQLDEVAFYKNPITNAEVIDRAHRKLNGEEVGLVAYYSFDNRNANDVAFERNATVQGTANYLRANVNKIPFLNEPVQGVTVADLCWGAINGTTQYVIDVAKDQHFQNKIVANLSLDSNAYHLANLNKNTKYYYHVKAKTNGEWSEYSATNEIFTLPGKALVLDGVDDYLTANNITSEASAEATIECWAKLDANAGSAEDGTLDRNVIWAINTNGFGNHYVLVYHPHLGRLNLWSDAEIDITVQNLFLGSSWHHFAVSLSNNKESVIYIDGKQLVSASFTSNAIESGCLFSIGQEWDAGSTPSDFFKGKIDEFRVWNIALTQEQVRANMNLSEPEGANEHYIAHYTFDEIDEDGTFKDWAKYNRATSVNGATNTNSEGVIIPITIEATDATPGSFKMHVNNIASAQSFEIEVAHDETFVPPLAVHKNIGRQLDYTIDDLCPGVKYYYRTRAIYGNNTISEWSTPDTVWTLDEDAAIANLEVTQGDYSNKLNLSWECTNSYLVTDFEIKRRFWGVGDFEYLATVENANDFYQYTDTTAEPGTYYEYTVQGLSYCYNNDTKIDTSQVGFRLPTLQLSKEVNMETQEAYVRLDWQYADGFCRNIEIERTDLENSTTITIQESADSLVYKDGEVDLCVPYRYKLIAVTRDFGNQLSSTADFTLEETLKGAIDTLDATKGYSDGKITLSWSAQKQNIIDEYKIHRRKYAKGYAYELVKTITRGETQEWIDENANPGEYYEYRIFAVGTCGENTIYSDTLTSVGFRQPEGVIAGQVNYKGGNPVKHVRLVVNYDETYSNYGKCIELDGSDSIKIVPRNTFDFSNGMTFETWLRPNNLINAFTIFENDSLVLKYNGANLVSTTGSAGVVYKLSNDTMVWNHNSWNHVAISASATELRLLINGQMVDADTNATALAFPSENIMGKNYNGFIDVTRIWKTQRSDSLIARYNGLMLPRDENNLVCALRFDEGLGAYAFDHSRADDVPNKSHANIYGATWSEGVASLAKLALGDKTDMNGNYIVKGIWFKGSGETFSITPAFGVHAFDPATKNMLISENSLIYNGQDFTDISSFDVSGSVYYAGTIFPVEGVNVLVDGSYIMNDENLPVTTNAEGQFDIEVPIGEHYLSLVKNGHVFSEGFWPEKPNDTTLAYHNFQDNVSGIKLFDGTKYKLAGRIVGGREQGDKEIGFGKSENNIGQYSVTLTTTKGYELDLEGNRSFEFTSDPLTGEFEVELLPEVYAAESIKPTSISSHYTFTSGDIIDMTEAHVETEVTDTVFVTDEYGITTIDTIYKYIYNARKDWVYRNTPILEVSNIDGGEVFADTIYTALDDEGNEVELALVETNGNEITYPFGKPVFHYGGEYNVLVSIFEEYVNYENSNQDRVPVTHGTISVANELSTNPSPQELELTDSGMVVYTFYGGFPNLTIDANNEDLSFTKKMEISANPEGGRPVQWRPADDPYLAYLMGAKATGNNFVTTGPNQVKFILRDPPGSNSYSYYEEGFTTSSTSSYSVGGSMGSSVSTEISFSPTINFSVGAFGFEKQTEIETENSVGMTTETELSFSGGQSWTETTSYMSSYQTSDDPAYTGADGDIFFGNSTNIVYGLSNFLEIMPPSRAEETAGNEVSGFTLGTRTGLRVNPEFGTMFIYSQNHIKNYLIPNLEMLRNLQLSNFPEKYEAVFTDENDEHYGTDNDDEAVWGSQASENPYNGPSYIFHALAHDDPNWHIDSVRFFNQQIRCWEDLLARNEWEKVNAQSMINNISFDAGAIYESSVTTATESTVTSAFEFTITATAAEAHGFTVDDVGASISMEASISANTSFESETTNTEEKTVGFVLADGDQGDYFTVDIKKCRGGNGPVFVSRGGQSSCPYEGEDLTEYYEPGQHTLNYATMRIEVPAISATQNAVMNVPEDQPAIYTLKLSNESEADADNWFMVKVDAASNPNGAKVKMDGGSMNSGVAILVPAGTTLTKTLEIEKGRPDVNDYEGINIIMHSLCQFDPTDDAEDIADTVSLSAYFTPVCTPVEIIQPADNWLVNVNADDQLAVQLGGYSLQHTAFEKMAFQYKPASGSIWFTQAMFFNDTTNFGEYSGEKYKIDNSPIVDYVWNTESVQDRNYQIKAVTYCTDESENESEILSGIVDGNAPQVFGTPSPADGILDANDDITITFNEPIEGGLILPAHISVEGVLNGAEINHGTSVAFDGIGDYVQTPDGINLAASSYTIEFWAQKELDAAGTVIAQGLEANQMFKVAFTTDSVGIIINGNTYNAENIVTDNLWHHYAVAFNNNSSLVQLYIDDQIAMEQMAEALTAEGVFFFGKSGIENEPDYFDGKMHDMRIWKRSLSYNEVVEQMNISLMGAEIGLSCYWPMDEGKGNLLLEKAHSRNANMFATWSLYPLSSGYSFNGTEDALCFTMGSIPVTSEMDFTIELWMKAPASSDTSYLFSNGNSSIDAYLPENTVEILLNAEGEIEVHNNGLVISSGQSFNDDQWHHVAFVVNRRSYASLFVDGNKLQSIAADEIGGMQNAFGYIGVRGYIDNTQQHQLSSYLNGTIDEVRVWNVARKAEQLDMYRNNKLSGTEVGLSAYFPFETYEENGGVLLSEVTLADMSINPYTETNNCDTLITFADVNFTNESPVIKRQRPREKVNFEYVVGEDRIVITPKDDLARIEKCILEISVRGVMDLHQNTMASPATWTAYVKKNPMAWEINQYSFEKDVDEALTFEATIINSGGVVQPFNIDNLPSWLTADPLSGSLDPDSETTIEFTINEGLNVGNYTEDIYLESNTGYNEKMVLDLRVFKPAPTWVVDQTLYQSSMNIIAQLTIKDVISNDAFDKIGVFSGDTCRGVCELQYKENYDAYFAFLVVYGNTEGENLSYKVWDASEGKVYSDVSPMYNFEPNAFYGNMAEPIMFNVGGNLDQSIDLNKGWNWISFNLEMSDNTVDGVFRALSLQEGDVVKHAGLYATYDNAFNNWKGSLATIELAKLYRANIQNGGSLVYIGQEVESADYPITLNAGWNRIGFIPLQNMTVNEALAGFEPQVNDVVKSQYEFALYDGYEWVGSMNYMQSGKGYMYKSLNSEPVTFVYPENSEMGHKTAIVSSTPVLSDYGINPAAYEYSLSVLAQLNETPIDENALVGAFINNELRGIANITEDNYTYLTVFGSSNELDATVQFKLLTQENWQVLGGVAAFEGNSVVGDLENPIQLSLQNISGIAFDGLIQISANPNPFSNTVMVNYQLQKASNVSLTVFNVLGEQVSVIVDQINEAGNYSVRWDGTNSMGEVLSSGVYFIHANVGDQTNVMRIVKE